MESFWALFQDYGTGGLASAGWIRQGQFDGASFTWLTDPIAFPDFLWTYRPDYTGTGYLAVDPLDPDFIWVGGCVSIAGTLFTRCYTYQVSTNTWTMLLNLDFVGPSTPLIVDMCFDVDGTAFLAVGGNGAFGLGGGVGEGGVYKSDARGEFGGIGAGYEHGLNSGNINHPASLTALDIAPTTGEGTRILYTAHTLTRVSGIATTGWVTSSSSDDGATWHDPVPTYNGNQFQLECLTMMRLGGAGGGLFYVADHSGTGAYSTANLSALIDGTPGDGPTGSYGGGIFQSGSIAHTFATDPDKAVAYPTLIATAMELCNSSDGGATWNRQSQGLEHAAFAYRGARTSKASLATAGVSLDNPAHSSELWWSEDAGATWNMAVAEENAIGLSLDFGPPVAPPTQRVALETMTFRDSRMFVGQTRFYVAGDSDDELRANALAIADALQLLSSGAWTGAMGPYTSGTGAPSVGSDALYRNAEMVLRLVFVTFDGVSIIVEIPCPIAELFIDDQETTSDLNPDYISAVTACFENKLCTRGGQLAYIFGGASRIMRGFRSTETIRTLDPNETNTAE